MYCPKCGTENAEAASFCRGCGANIALVPQALTGTLPPSDAGVALTPRERRALAQRRKEPPVETAVVPFFGGLGFFLVALAVMLFTRNGLNWGFWLFIPAFFMMGGGVAGYLRRQEWLKTQQGQAPQFPSYAPPSAIPHARETALPPGRETAEIYTPGTVTEGTTRLLDREQ